MNMKTRKPVLSEHNEQSTLMSWWAVYPKKGDAVLFAIPNAAKRSMRLANYMRAEGLIAGIPDLFLAAPRAQYGGLFIEMKRVDRGWRNVSEDQKAILFKLERAGYAVKVAFGFEQAKAYIEQYLTYGNFDRQNEKPKENVPDF